MVTSGTDMFRELCNTIGRPFLADDKRFASNYARVQNNAVLSTALAEAFKERSAAEWVDKLQEREIPVTLIATAEDVARDAHVLRRRMAIKTEDERFLCAGNPIKMGGWPETNMKLRPNPPRLNENLKEIIELSQRGRQPKARL